METALSPRQVAAAIGVSEASVRRWADNGQIRMTRTSGGHRRISLPDAIRFVRESSFDVVRPDLLTVSEPGHRPGRSNAIAAQHDDFLAALAEGDSDLASGLIMRMYLNGVDAAQICDGAIRHAMCVIGKWWPEDKRGIFVEHRATSICADVLGRLRAAFPHTKGNSPAIAVGGAPESDPYILPTLMASTVLADVGYETVNLGPNTPLQVLGESVVELKAPLLWIATTAPLPAASLEREIVQLLEIVEPINGQVVIGGLNANRLRLPDSSAVHRFGSMSEMAAFAEGILAGR
jgi:excisionase family DNA binding protein